MQDNPYMEQKRAGKKWHLLVKKEENPKELKKNDSIMIACRPRKTLENVRVKDRWRGKEEELGVDMYQ